jgi:capsular exopolysaccharide synthesis family protein
MDSSQLPPSLSNTDNRRFLWFPGAAPMGMGMNQDDEGGINLGQVVGTLRRRLPVIVGVTTVVTSAALLKALTSTPTYQSGFEILTKPVTVENQVISSVPQTLSNKEQETPEKGLDQTKLKLLKSPKLLAPILKELKTTYPDMTYDKLFSSLIVTPIPNSEILAVSFQDTNPEKVKKVLELVEKAYLKYSLEERLADVYQGIEFVEAQLPQLQKRVEVVQDRLQTFRQQYNLIDPESTSKQLADQTSTIGQQRLEAQVKLNEARALYSDLSSQRAQTDEESAASSALRNNSRYQSLLNQILEVESQVAKESSLFHPSSPNVQVLKDQEGNLLPLLRREGQRVQAEVASQIRELEARNQILAQAEAVLNQRIKQLSVISRQYTDIQQELKIATDNLNQFLTKREALRIDAGQRKTPWQILTPVGDPIPSSANVKRSGLLGVILGLLLGVGVALLLDKLSNVLHTPEEIKDASKLPILGVIPFNPELPAQEELNSVEKLTLFAQETFVQQLRQKLGFETGSKSELYGASVFLEAFRSLYTNILLLNPDTPLGSFVISSASPGEGKSTVAIYLAHAAAALGKTVLLVDTDLRRPQVHDRLGVMNTYGLSNLISSELDFEQVIQRSPLESNLLVLTAGQIPPDATRMISSNKMQSLMEQFHSHFDLVIYDTPPLLGLADAKLLAAKTDGLALVVGLDKTKSSALTQALEGLKLSSVPVLGAIANGSKEYTSNLHDSYHRYYITPADSQPVPDSQPMDETVTVSGLRSPEK